MEYEEGDTIRTLPCHHEFHRTCVDKWLKEIHRYEIWICDDNVFDFFFVIWWCFRGNAEYVLYVVETFVDMIHHLNYTDYSMRVSDSAKDPKTFFGFCLKLNLNVVFLLLVCSFQLKTKKQQNSNFLYFKLLYLIDKFTDVVVYHEHLCLWLQFSPIFKST